MAFSSRDGGDDGKLTSVCLVDISEILVTQDVFFVLSGWNFECIILRPSLHDQAVISPIEGCSFLQLTAPVERHHLNGK